MSDATDAVDDEMIDPVTGEIIDQKELTERLLAQARERGVSLMGPGWPAEPPHEERARDRLGGGDNRAPGPRAAAHQRARSCATAPIDDRKSARSAACGSKCPGAVSACSHR